MGTALPSHDLPAKRGIDCAASKGRRSYYENQFRTPPVDFRADCRALHRHRPELFRTHQRLPLVVKAQPVGLWIIKTDMVGVTRIGLVKPTMVVDTPA